MMTKDKPSQLLIKQRIDAMLSSNSIIIDVTPTVSLEAIQ